MCVQRACVCIILVITKKKLLYWRHSYIGMHGISIVCKDLPSILNFCRWLVILQKVPSSPCWSSWTPDPRLLRFRKPASEQSSLLGQRFHQWCPHPNRVLSSFWPIWTESQAWYQVWLWQDSSNCWAMHSGWCRLTTISLEATDCSCPDDRQEGDWPWWVCWGA